ncbi:MAG: nuclear transport factor 2 family protein [bacterium]|nr:nuclear transport factor 2 family protein [bacterium]
MMLKTHVGRILIGVLATAGVLGAAESQPPAVSPSEVAEKFLKAFERKDIDAVVSLFAPGALVQRARVTETEPEFAHFGVEEWAAGAQQGIAGIHDFKIEIIETKAVGFGEGTTVSVHSRATGQVGENTFVVNDAVDSFSMTHVDGEWRILLYNSVEKLVFRE